jgi:DNA-binding MarR family transcriptional regulator
MGDSFDASILIELVRAGYVERRPSQETGAASRFDSRDDYFLTPSGEQTAERADDERR